MADTTEQKSTNPFGDSDEDEENELEGEYGEEEQDSGNPFAVSNIDEMERHWRDLADLMSSSNLTDPFALQEFKEHLAALGAAMERARARTTVSDSTGECLELLLSENMLEKIYLFTTRQRVYSRDIRLTLLKFYTSLLSLPGPPLFIHQQFLKPLTRFLKTCETAKEQNLSSAMVPLLQQICVLIQENDSFLDLFFTDGAGQVPSRFLVFSQLVTFMHDASDIGNRARDAILLCLSVAGRTPHSTLSDFMITYTDFCQVLATGLSALYSSLPTNVEMKMSDDEWQAPLSYLETSVCELKQFMLALDFCNSVLQMAPVLVCQAIVSLVKNGFLQQVVGPAILQSQPNEAATAIGYLTIFLLNITNSYLMRIFVQFICTGRHDNHPILNTLIQNISSDSTLLSAISLQLFHVLLDLNCEDVMLELILKYLLTGAHIMPSQVAIVSKPDIYCSAARQLLLLVPSCCSKAEQLYNESITRQPVVTTTTSPSSRPSSPSLEPPLDLETDHTPNNHISHASNSQTSFSHTPNRRSRRGSNSSSCSTSSSNIQSSQQPSNTSAHSTPLMTSLASLHNTVFEAMPPEVSYHGYIMEGRGALDDCLRACQCWSSYYGNCTTVDTPLVDTAHTTRPSDINIVVSPSDTVSSSGDTVSAFDTEVPVVVPSPNVSPRLSPRRQTMRRLSDQERLGDGAGLFLKVAMEKLSKMLQHSPVVNVLLLKVVVRLCQYPQPLLRSLLLNHHLVLRPGIPNMIQILRDLKQTIDRLAKERENFECRLGRARKTMIFKAAIRNGLVDEATAAAITHQLAEGSRSESRLSDGSDPPDSLTTPTKGDKHEEVFKPRRRAMTEGSRSMSRRKRKQKVTLTMVYNIVMFGEFVKELSALALEQAIINPAKYHGLTS